MPGSAPDNSVSPVPGQGPLSPDAKRALADAANRFGKIRRAVTLARFNAWTMTIFGGFAVLGGIFSIPALLLGLALLAAGFHEFKGAAAMRKLDRNGPRRLAINQVFVVAAVAAYCLWNIHLANNQPLSPQVSELIDSLGAQDQTNELRNISRSITIGVYFLVTLLTGVFQGMMAIYYLGRRAHIDAYAASTPEWVQDIQRSGAIAA